MKTTSTNKFGFIGQKFINLFDPVFVRHLERKNTFIQKYFFKKGD